MNNDKPRGFAAMSPEKQRAFASQGGKAAHQQGTAHIFTSEEAKKAGLKGGRSLVAKLGKEYMSEIGRKGGAIRKAKVAFVPPETMKDLFESENAEEEKEPWILF